MVPEFLSFSRWEDGFLAVAVTVFLLLSGAGLLVAWINRRKD